MNEIPETFTPPPMNKMADDIGVIGFGTVVCEVVKDPTAKADCRKLVEPLEKGQSNAIDTLVELLIHNPDEIDDAAERFNYNMEKAVKIAEERLKAKDAT